MIAFSPGAFTDVCITGLQTINGYLDKLNNNAVELVGISVDSPFVLEKWATDNGIEFTLLSDPFRECINVFGVEFIGLG